MSNSRIRQPARRVFAEEFNEAEHTFKEGDDDRSPKFVLLPTGGKANRVLISGTITEKEEIGSNSEFWRARIVDPTGTFNIYAGQYQPEVMEQIRNINPPEYVTVVGKPDTYQPEEDGDVITNIKPESISVVSADERDRWVVDTAEQTIKRIQEENEMQEKAREIHGTSTKYRDVVEEALENLS